jgi:hypothetical protein
MNRTYNVPNQMSPNSGILIKFPELETPIANPNQIHMAQSPNSQSSRKPIGATSQSEQQRYID